MADEPDREGPREGPETTVETMQRLTDPAVKAAGAAYERSAQVARQGVEAASAKVSEWPATAVLLAVCVGVAFGWAMRGAAEEDQRRSWLAGLLDELRGRR